MYAVTGGTVVRRNDTARRGCTHYIIHSDKDGKDWAHIHLTIDGATIEQGATVKAGDLLGYIGLSTCADNTTPHLHIDSGYGEESQRNPLVNDVINGLYEQLPD